MVYAETKTIPGTTATCDLPPATEPNRNGDRHPIAVPPGRDVGRRAIEPLLRVKAGSHAGG
jgi:hypothetical protein